MTWPGAGEPPGSGGPGWHAPDSAQYQQWPQQAWPPVQNPYDPHGSLPPVHNGRNLAIAGTIGVLALAGVIVTAIVLSHKHSSPSQATPAGVGPSIINTSTNPAATATTGATPPGGPWQTVSDHGAAIDVPPDWVLKPASNDNPHMAADYKEGTCPAAGVTDQNRAEVMVASSDDTDLPTGAITIANELVPIAYGTGNPQATLGQLQQANAGGFRDLPVTVKLTPTDACSPPGGIMHVLVHAADKGGTFALIVIGDQGVSDALSPDVLNRVAASARSSD